MSVEPTIRWTVFGLGALAFVPVFGLQVINPIKLGTSSRKASNLLRAFIGALAAISALWRPALGWYAALALPLYVASEAALMWALDVPTIPAADAMKTRLVTAAYILVNLALLALLLLPVGRRAFRAGG